MQRLGKPGRVEKRVVGVAADRIAAHDRIVSGDHRARFFQGLGGRRALVAGGVEVLANLDFARLGVFVACPRRLRKGGGRQQERAGRRAQDNE